MRKFLLLSALVYAVSLSSLAQDKRRPDVVKGELIKVLPSLKNLRPDPTFNPRVTRDVTGLVVKKTYKETIIDFGTRSTFDPVVQKGIVKNSRQSANQTDLPNIGTVVDKNFDGMGFTNVSPADPSMTAGPNHLIQMVNGSQGSYFRIWDKAGNNVVTQTFMYQLFATPGYAGAGDPIVLYDQFADRYVLTEFGFSGGVTSFINTLIFAVSISNDPTGGWYIYKYVDNSFFVDYPHYSAWPDAYYGTSNDFNTAGNAYLGSSVYVFEKAKMLAGNASASLQKFRLTSSEYSTKFQAIAPVNISGNTAPATGSGGLFLYYHDDNRTASTTDVDSVGFVSLKADFSNAANTTLTFEQSITVAAFKGNICATRNCIASGGISGYDAISDRFMNKIYYRNFGTHESIVATHTVDANYPSLPVRSALRWYEFRKSGGNWTTYQQSTYSPDEDGRFMASININSKGQIALAFNSSGVGKFASIMFTGRNESDPLGEMVYDEGELKKGEGYGTFSNRWGDYNDLVTDQVNDSLFWFTAMYGYNNVNWRTRVAAFKLEQLPALDAKLLRINSPDADFSQCSNTIIPNITFRNAGTTLLTSLNINTQVDNGSINISPWTGSLNFSQTMILDLPPIAANAGIHTLKIFTSDPNGVADENKINDTAYLSFTILAPLPGPVIEGFEGTSFAPLQWRIVNENAGSYSWDKSTAGFKSGAASAVMRCFDYSNINQVDFLLSPIIDITAADSVILSFERAYVQYNANPNLTDTLEVVISDDCGATFTSVWKRGGAELATTTGYQTATYIPSSISDWQNVRLDLKPFAASNSITVGFKTINKFGQNIYVDDINIKTFKVPNRDALVYSVQDPGTRLCNRLLTPSLQIGTLGKDTLTSVKVMYRINNNALDSFLFSGLLTKGQTTTIVLKNVNFLTGGNYSFTAYTKQPNGLNDENTSNDTLKVNFVVIDPQIVPVIEGFEQKGFPPVNWSISSSNSDYTWEKTDRASSEKTFSAWIRNYRFNSNGKPDDLYSPLVQVGAIDSVYVHFDVAHVTSKFPGSTSIPLDTLEVLLTTDCGKTLQPVYKKWGEDLQTVGDPNFPYTYPANDTIGFIPAGIWQYRTELLDLTKMIPLNTEFQLVFRSMSNKGNNIYLDNIHISTVTLQPRLKQNGFLISPNPFDGAFNVRHFFPPPNLKAIQVTNAAGQLILERIYNGNASNNIRIDLHTKAKGIYQIKLLYDNKVITERIIKKK